jgi:uncharacterized BrkB/YihY/UPF0761 family membrane protein
MSYTPPSPVSSISSSFVQNTPTSNQVRNIGGSLSTLRENLKDFSNTREGKSSMAIGVSLLMYSFSTAFLGITIKDCYTTDDQRYMVGITVITGIIILIMMYLCFKEYKNNDKKLNPKIGFFIVLLLLLLSSTGMMMYNLSQIWEKDCKDISNDTRKTLRIAAFINLIATILFSHVAIMYYSII